MTTTLQTKIQNIDFNKWTNYFFIGLAFSIPISKALDSLFAILIILSWLLEGDLYRKWKIISKDRLSLTLLFLIFFSFISLIWSPDLQYALHFITIKYWNFLIIPIMLTSFNTKYIKYVLNAFLLSMLLSEIVSYGIFFELWSYNNVPPTDPSPFMNHTDYSTFLSFALIIILTKLATLKSMLWRGLFSLYFITGLTNLFINGGRTGQVAFIFTLMVMAIFYFRLSFKYLVGLFLLLITTVILAYNVSSNFHYRMNQLQNGMINMYEKNDYSGGLATRIALWEIGTKTFLKHPLLGTGIGGETKDIPLYSAEYNFKTLETYTDYHNTFIMYSVQLGIIGLFISVTVFYLLFTFRFHNRIYKTLSIAFATIYLLHSMGGFSFHILDSLLFLVVFSSLFNAITYQEQKYISD